MLRFIVLIFLSLSQLSMGNSSVVEKIIIESNDRMRFNTKKISVSEGSVIELTLVHTGKRSKSEMGHNFVLLNQGENIRDFAMDVKDLKKNGFIPELKTNIIAFTKVIGGGESTTITFKSPEKGTYPYLCSVPGHFGLMKGVLIVE